MNETDMYNERQADLFDKLTAAGLTHAEIVRLCRVGDRQAYRLQSGCAVLTADMAAGLIGHPRNEIGDLVCDHLFGGTGRIAIQMQEDDAGAVEDESIAALEAVTQFMKRRRHDAKDGVITEPEKNGELELVRSGIRILHQLHAAVAGQKPQRHLAAPLKLDRGRGTPTRL